MAHGKLISRPECACSTDDLARLNDLMPLYFKSTRLRPCLCKPQSATNIVMSPKSRQISSRVFFQDFSTYLEDIVMAAGILLIAGDFNFHVDCHSDNDAINFAEIFLMVFNNL